jgi:hypothetical protein
MGLGGNTSFKSDMFKIEKARSPFTGPGGYVTVIRAELVAARKNRFIFFIPWVVIRGGIYRPLP